MTYTHLKSAIDTVRGAMLDRFMQEMEPPPERHTEVNEALSYLGSNLNTPALQYCLNGFINSELDTSSSGNNGLGRATNYYPRLAGYFYKQMNELNDRELELLYDGIRDVILGGYLSFHLTVPYLEAKVSSKFKIYEAWIPNIYATQPKEFEPDEIGPIIFATNNLIETLKEQLLSFGMKGGGWFKRDKTGNILLFYAIAGYGLRLVEVAYDDFKESAMLMDSRVGHYG